MSSIGCLLWWLLLGGLLGWLASWLFAKPKPVTIEKIVDRPVDRIVEKIVDRPVDKIVEKIVDRPVDRIVEKLVDNPAHLSKIATLGAEVAGIAALKMTIDQLRNAPPKTVEKIVEKIVDRPVDRIVEKIVDRPVDRIVEKVVEKIVDRPVDRIVEKVVEKIVDRPVDRIVEKMVDNPSHLAKIATLSAEVAGIAALKMTIDQMRNAPPKTVEKIVDRPVEKIVEKIVDRPVDRIVEKVVEKIVDRPVDRIVEKLVDNPAHLSKIATLGAEVAGIAALKMTIDQLRNAPPKTVEKIVEKIVDRPVDRIVEKVVEKIVDRPVDRVVEKVVEKIVDRPVDRVVEKMVDNPSHLAKIATLSAEVAGIAALKMTIDQLRNAPPKTVEKIVEKIVDRPVDRIVEKIVDRPIDRIVEKMVDNPVHLQRVRAMEAEVATIAGLKSTISQLQSAPPKIVEKIVEKLVDRPVDRVVERVVEKIVDRPVDRIVEKMVDRQFDNPVHLARIKSLEADLASRDGELLSLRRPNAVLDKAAATAAGFKVRGMDDLEVIEGIGPKIADLFHKAGIHMFWELEKTPVTRMQEILTAAGPHYKLANPASWAQQSGLAANNRWAELKTLQDALSAGVRK